ncbi:MAG: site-specific DNA-methyltransferase, partial [Methylococcales bacterium]|nr:site-specific DNA-methyltransferase [Methylococcales bacterium]
IDPPYNTKSDAFIYNDDFSTQQTQILAELGYDKDNIDYIKNIYGAKTHSGWLSFMYPRLLLAKDLLRDDGVIFISIDDNEQAQLKLLCDEVFGEENFVSNIIWQRAFSPKNDAKYLSVSHDNLLMYAKNIENFVCGRLKRTDDINARYTNQDNDTRGFWTSSDLTVKTYSEKYDYPITTPSGRKIPPTEGRCWSMPKNRIQELINDNRIWFGVDGDNVPRLKRFLSEVQDGITPTTLWLHQEVGHNQEGRQEVKALFDNKGLFDGVKPVRFLSKILRVANLDSNDIILDFFAGSGTTAEAVMRLNAEDGGNRSFILVQIPQAIDPQKQKEAYRFVTEALNKPATIFEITAERLRRAGQKIEAEAAVDTGFRVFDIIDDTDALILQKPLSEVTQADLSIFIQHNTDSDSRERVLYNLLLSEGLPLTTVINELIPDTVYLADDVLLILGAVDLTLLTDTLKELSHSATPAVYLTVYAPWVRDDNFMLGLKTLAESLGFSSDKLRLRG